MIISFTINNTLLIVKTIAILKISINNQKHDWPTKILGTNKNIINN